MVVCGREKYTLENLQVKTMINFFVKTTEIDPCIIIQIALSWHPANLLISCCDRPSCWTSVSVKEMETNVDKFYCACVTYFNA
jgi:hypothetical protein